MFGSPGLHVIVDTLKQVNTVIFFISLNDSDLTIGSQRNDRLLFAQCKEINVI